MLGVVTARAYYQIRAYVGGKVGIAEPGCGEFAVYIDALARAVHLHGALAGGIVEVVGNVSVVAYAGQAVFFVPEQKLYPSPNLKHEVSILAIKVILIGFKRIKIRNGRYCTRHFLKIF